MRMIRYILLLLGFLIGSSTLMAEQALRGDGELRLFNYHLDEFLEVKFRDKNQYIEEEFKRIHHILRSRGNEEIIPIAQKLLDLIDHLQDHFGADQIEIISGYRDKKFNAQLKKEGHAVSPVSLHMKGQALDIHIDEVREETLRDYLLSLQLGGVGYYGPMDFVHIDTGPARQWGGKGPFPRKLVGVLKPKAPTQFISDKNDYLSGEILKLQWILPDSKLNLKDLRLEQFRRGKWKQVPLPTMKGMDKATLIMSFDFSAFKDLENAQLYGKHRFLFQRKGSDEVLSSNEFYLKKK